MPGEATVEVTPPGATRDESKRFYYWLLAAMGLALAVRLYYCYHYKWDQKIWGDAFYYHYQANGLVRGLGFISPYDALDRVRRLVDFSVFNHGNHQNAEHPPMYTLFLAIPSALGFHSFREHMVASAILGSLTVGMIGIAGRAIAGARVGIVAAIIGAIYANLWINDGLVMSETITAFVVALVIWLAYRFWQAPTTRNAAFLGLACGLAALTRAEVVFFIPIVALPLVVWARGLDRRQRFQRAGAILVVAALPVLPWVGYNLSRFEKPVFLSNGADYTLSNTNCDSTYYGERLGWWDLRCKNNIHKVKGDDSVNSLHFRHVALDYISAHKTRVPVVLAARVGRMWGLFHPFKQLVWEDFEQGRGPREITKLALGQYYALAILAIIGLVMMRRRRQFMYPLIGLAVIATLAGMAAFGSTRYRIPAEITLVIAGAVPIAALLDRWFPRRRVRAPEEPAEEPGVDTEPPSGNGAGVARDTEVVAS